MSIKGSEPNYIEFVGFECFAVVSDSSCDNMRLGILENVVNFGGGDLFYIRDGKKSLYLPIWYDLVRDFSFSKRAIYFASIEDFI